METTGEKPYIQDQPPQTPSSPEMKNHEVSIGKLWKAMGDITNNFKNWADFSSDSEAIEGS